MNILNQVLKFLPKKKVKHTHNLVSVDRKMILSNENLPFALREGYRTIATNIVYQPIEDRCRRFAVTSSIPGEGKTTVSLNMAATLAQSLGNNRVLLIDGDLRKPRVHKLLNVSTSIHGLTEYLAGIDEEPNICSCDLEGLSVLYSGKTSLNPAGLISSDRMNALMDYCKEKFDYVIIDTPPVNVVSDTLLFNKHLNGYIVVTKSGYSDVNSLNDTLEAIKMVDGKIAGVVLTCAEMKSGGHYGRYGKGGHYEKYSSAYSSYGDKDYAYGYGYESTDK